MKLEILLALIQREESAREYGIPTAAAEAREATDRALARFGMTRKEVINASRMVPSVDAPFYCEAREQRAARWERRKRRK
jgi:hypothetical protein